MALFAPAHSIGMKMDELREAVTRLEWHEMDIGLTQGRVGMLSREMGSPREETGRGRGEDWRADGWMGCYMAVRLTGLNVSVALRPYDPHTCVCRSDVESVLRRRSKKKQASTRSSPDCLLNQAVCFYHCVGEIKHPHCIPEGNVTHALDYSSTIPRN